MKLEGVKGGSFEDKRDESSNTRKMTFGKMTTGLEKPWEDQHKH